MDFTFEQRLNIVLKFGSLSCPNGMYEFKPFDDFDLLFGIANNNEFYLERTIWEVVDKAFKVIIK